MGRRFACALACLLALAGGAQGTCGEGGEDVRIAAVTERLELVLADGRVIRPAGLEAPPPGLDPALLARARRDAADWLAGGEASMRLVQARPDRWGRATARISAFAPEAGEIRDVSVALAEWGFARVAEPAEAGPCRAELMAAETAAIARRLGVWADPYYSVVAASDRALLLARAGQFTVVEGRVRRVGTGRKRIFIDFGPTREDFTATMPSRMSKTQGSQDFEPTRLAGRAVRLRGVVEARQGRPTLDLAGPGALHILDAPLLGGAERP